MLVVDGVNNKIKVPKIVNNLFRVNDTILSSTFSRQCSTSSNTSRDSRNVEERIPDDVLHMDRQTTVTNKVALPKLAKFKPPEVGDYFEIEVMMAASPSNFLVSFNLLDIFRSRNSNKN